MNHTIALELQVTCMFDIMTSHMTESMSHMQSYGSNITYGTYCSEIRRLLSMLSLGQQVMPQGSSTLSDNK